MGTPNTPTVQDIVRRRIGSPGPLTSGDKAALLDARLESLDSSLRYLPLGELLDVVISWNNIPLGLVAFSIRYIQSEIVEENWSLGDPRTVRGIFYQVSSPEDSVCKIAGLDRVGNWVWVNIQRGPLYLLLGDPNLPETETYLVGMKRPTALELVRLLGKYYWPFWEAISRRVEFWVEDRRGLLKQAERVEKHVGQEDALARLLRD